MPHHDLIIIGAGPGGYVAAIRAAQLGRNVACVEKEPLLGGTCLRVGCIPSKALLESSRLYEEAARGWKERGILPARVQLDLAAMIAHKQQVVDSLGAGIDGLFRKHNVTRYAGDARFDGPQCIIVENAGGSHELTADNVIIATGSSPATLQGVQIDEDRIVSSTGALAFSEVPRHLIVVGAGYIGLELGTVWRRLGAQVSVLEYLDRILPGMDAGLAKEAQRIFQRQGLTFRLGCRVKGVSVNRRSCEVQIEGGEPVRGDRVLVAVGRRPNTQGLQLERIGVETDDRGFIRVNEHFETSVPGVFAIGDVIGGAMLAHKAEEEGIACVEQLYTDYGHVNYDAIPGVVFTDPEIATVGKTEEALNAEGIPFRKGQFPFRANSRARAAGYTEGFVKILADERTDRVLGVHVIGPHAGELIAECTAAIEFGASSEDIARCCHAHPTFSEAVKEAALAVDGRTINL